MIKLIIVLLLVSLITLLLSIPAFANPPTPACNELNVAHGRIHDPETRGEDQLHTLRLANHCSQ